MSGYILDLRKVVGSRPLIMAAAGVVLVDGEGRILLQHRSDNGCWGIPGGSMELGETFEETARREVLEETGLSVGVLQLLYLNSGQKTFYEYPNGHQVYLASAIYTTTEFTGQVRRDEDESLDLQWFHRTDLPDAINPLDKPAIDFYINHVKKSSRT